MSSLIFKNKFHCFGCEMSSQRQHGTSDCGSHHIITFYRRYLWKIVRLNIIFFSFLGSVRQLWKWSPFLKGCFERLYQKSQAYIFVTVKPFLKSHSPFVAILPISFHCLPFSTEGEKKKEYFSEVVFSIKEALYRLFVRFSLIDTFFDTKYVQCFIILIDR